MENDPLATLRQELEQLDIKFITDYSINSTTHVVSKKRNTARCLQALINGHYMVSNTFTDAIVRAASMGDSAESALESNFDLAWPDPLQHLPPRGNESTQRPVEDYGPDPERQYLFEGYSFVFYDQIQYTNLMAPITNGGGKALHCDVVPNETEVDDFIRYVKSVAGEKGLGSFEDGSEGRGVAVVRFIPPRGDDIQWYADFFTAVSLRLDHRMIDQKEFLEAILIKNAAMLRRPLEAEPSSEEVAASQQQNEAQSGRRRPQVTQEPQPRQQEEQQPAPRVRPSRRPVTKRFKGFDDDDDNYDAPVGGSVAISQGDSHDPETDQFSHGRLDDGLFVSQGSQLASQGDGPTTRRGTRKRALPIPEDDIMEDIAPAAALVKRRRIERGEDPVVAYEEPEFNAAESTSGNIHTAAKKTRVKKEINILEAAGRAREEAQARAEADEEDLNVGPGDVDLAEIRRLAIVEVVEPRQPAQRRTHEQDVEDGRWDPKWNGRRNFKRFKRQGEASGRLPNKTIVPLVEVKTKGFGIGDDYWLEDEGSSMRIDSQNRSQEQQRSSIQAQQPKRPPQQRTVMSDSEDEDEDEDVTVSLGIPPSEESFARPRPSRPQRKAPSASASQAPRTQTRTAPPTKRPLPTPTVEQSAKRARPTRRTAVVDNDSDEDQGFQFGRRR